MANWKTIFSTKW